MEKQIIARRGYDGAWGGMWENSTREEKQKKNLYQLTNIRVATRGEKVKKLQKE